MVDDCERFGIVNNFSAYKFENAIGHLKLMKRSDNKVLEQFANRTMEKSITMDLSRRPKSKDLNLI